MSTETVPGPVDASAADDTSTIARSRPTRRRRLVGGGQSLVAQATPLVWLHGGGLVICLAMIVGLLLLVVYQGITTFWPVPLVLVRTIDGNTYLGEVTRVDRYELSYQDATVMSGPVQQKALELLNPRFREKLLRLHDRGGLAPELTALDPFVEKAVLKAVADAPQVLEAAAVERNALAAGLGEAFASQPADRIADVAEQLAQAIREDASGGSLFALWTAWHTAEAQWLSEPDVRAMQDALASTPQLLRSIWGSHALSLLSYDVSVGVNRRLFRTGNFELTHEHFTWVSDFQIEPGSETMPEWALLFERLAWGRFYGLPKAMQIDGEAVATEPHEIWNRFRELHKPVRDRWQRRRRLETVDTGHINLQQEDARLRVRQVELRHGRDSDQWARANADFEQFKRKLDEQFAAIRQEIVALDQENARYQLLVETADGQETALALTDIVRTYPANRLSFVDKARIYVSRWGEFLTADPREANSEGGVLPAIWGTVVMTLLMSVAVVPFGVLAALYLREYAKAGLLVSTVRIAVNNLAGVPSIVFGVFGLGFFCYLIGASIDQLFFEAKLPSPTFGTGGLMWASFTLALLTLPVVIVATEEALAAVPRSMREGSLACGATKWQTIRRIVLPRAMPGIMTGMILAMARGAGEVAPLMLVGAVKLAPELPVDGVFPFVHLERSFMHLGFHIYDLGFQSQNSEAAKPMVFTTTLLLIALIALMNFLAIGLRARLRKRFAYSQF
ncbi:MAG: phosphate ABC transporter permease PstA [Pirellulaceae bacterium]|nr:phosphate ABC transporter permease PstA [Pirellulaceae bacterium]